MHLLLSSACTTSNILNNPLNLSVLIAYPFCNNSVVWLCLGILFFGCRTYDNTPHHPQYHSILHNPSNHNHVLAPDKACNSYNPCC